MHIRIRAVGAYEPPVPVTNDDLARTVDTDDRWIRTHTGIRSRHLAGETQESSDLGVSAIRSMLTDAALPLSHIDGIVVATATPDYPGFPSTACVIAGKLGLADIPAFDIGAGCTGFVYALETARALMTTGTMERPVVVGTETLSRIVNWTDRNTCVLFGDGAGCVMLEKSESPGILDGILGSSGAGAEALTVDPGRRTIAMDGHAVYSFAVRAIGETIAALLSRNGMAVEDIAYIVPHQANRRIIESCAKRYGIPQKKFFMNIEDHANTSAASIPLALKEMETKGLLHEGDRILLVGFGAGLTYGGTLLIW